MTAGDLIFNGAGKAATTEARRALYDDALPIIRREFAADLRLAEVARRIGRVEPVRSSGRSPSTASCSFSEELRATRLNVAARPASRYRPPVGAVARRVGTAITHPSPRRFGAPRDVSARLRSARPSFGGKGQGTTVSPLRFQDKSLWGRGGGDAASPARA